MTFFFMALASWKAVPHTAQHCIFLLKMDRHTEHTKPTSNAFFVRKQLTLRLVVA